MLVNEIISQENTTGFKDFMGKFDGLEYQKSFASFSTVKHPMRRNGLISTYDLIDDLASSGETIDDIYEFLEEYGDLEILNEKHDNTYNYCGYLDSYVNFSTYELENDQVLVTLAVGLGLDPRGGYTDKIAFIFESEDDFLEEFSKTYELLDFEFKVFDGKKFYASFDGEALSEFGYLNIIDQQTEETLYYNEVVLDTTDKEDIADTVSEILEVDNIEIGKVNYFWEN